MANDCLQRAFQAGLFFCGIKDEVPDISWSNELHELAAKYNLKCSCETDYNKWNNDPVLVFYEDEFTKYDDLCHAVFCSDIQPFLDKNVLHVVYGWNDLRSKAQNKFLQKIRNILYAVRYSTKTWKNLR